MFYGQFGEDKYMSQFFDKNYKGLCVDVGASDGISGNNTYYFEINGWESLCIEPVPESYNKCNSLRKKTLNYCVSNYDKNDIDFNVVRFHDNNVSAVSSLILDERLIKSHEHLIQNIEKIPVKVKSLNTIFEKENMCKNIDFISIDTENTELDVLKGLDFNNYNVNFLIIENNFDDYYIEQYLSDKNFKKIVRIAVNDIYVNKNYLNLKIHNQFEIVQANYYISENEKLGNVTEIVNILAKKYTIFNNNNIIVSNDIFMDTFPNVEKKLFIKIKNIYTQKVYNYVFDEYKTLDFDLIFNNLKNELA